MAKEIPTYDALMNPLLEALFTLGGSGSIAEIDEKVIEMQMIDEEMAAVPHNPEKSNLTEIGYRLSWARTYLRKYGFLDNSSRGVWTLTQRAKEQRRVNPKDVVRAIRTAYRNAPAGGKGENGAEPNIELSDMDTSDAEDWRDRLYYILTKEIAPDAFERLTKQLLRESGFVQVEVTGKSADGGIDGKGIARIHGFMSFHVIFQCKRYQGSVSASAIRDFRGAMVGRADKGLFITTGTFTVAAVREAKRDGAPPIDLVDGRELAEKLKEFELGVKTELIEEVTVDADWFRTL